MIKVTIISLLSFLILLPALRLGLIYGYYFLNKASISEEYCVNIAKPMLMCSGKCYINEVIEKPSSESGKAIPVPSAEDLRPVFQYISQQVPLDLQCFPLLSKVGFKNFQGAYSFLYAPNTFRPPPALS